MAPNDAGTGTRTPAVVSESMMSMFAAVDPKDNAVGAVAVPNLGR